ncbi:hypothetical protein BDF19DRAFT_429585 [Syncephalis fuscata]|nr:hypothetical protein BDF19DRAFT_429585 [Syncephalis fuscata]
MAQPAYAQPLPKYAKNGKNATFCIDGTAHNWEREYTCCGILWLIILFPWGICCCYFGAKKRCSKCQQVLKT